MKRPEQTVFDATRTPELRTETHFGHHVERTPLRRRIDAPLLLGVSVCLAMTLVAIFFIVQWIHAQGWLEPPLVRPLPDERILTNVRDHLPDRPLLDAVYHAPDGRIFATQQGGLIHRYDPDTRLWSSEEPFDDSDPINRDLVMLRSGCGLDWRNAEESAACPDPDSLWAVTAEGGLARRQNGRWRIVVRDSFLTRPDGSVVAHADLTAAAVSEDRRWLLVGVRDSGVGLYNIADRLWQPLLDEVQAALPSPQVTHIVAWGGRFWVGGPHGLISLDVHRFQPAAQVIDAIDGEVVDLDLGPAGLWVLERRPCAVGGDDCRRLSRLRGPGVAPEPVIDERNVYPELGIAGLIFAQDWGERLVVAGESGIFSYDPLLHNWTRLFDKAVSAVLPLANDGGFYFAFGDSVGLLHAQIPSEGEDPEFDFWELSGESTAKLLYGPAGEPLVLTRSGNLYALRAGGGSGTVHTIFRVTDTALDPDEFSGAVASGDHVLLRGPDGLLLHDVARRAYTDVVSSTLPDWMLEPETRLVNAGDAIFALDAPGQRRVRVYALPADRLFDEGYLASELADVSSRSVSGPFEQVWRWDADSIGILNEAGNIERIRATSTASQLGPPKTEMAETTWLDAAVMGNDLLLATERGVRRYDGDDRGWGSWLASPADDDVLEVAVWNRQPLAMTDEGRLVEIGSDSPVLIGADDGIRIDDDELSDALADGAKLYLAGAGMIDEYDGDSRRVTKRWTPAESGDVSLVALVDGRPLALIDGRASLGDDVIDASAGEVLTLSFDERMIWTTRELDGVRYFKGYRVTANGRIGQAVCFFRTPTAGATRVVDARQLPGGDVVVSTEAGLRFYRPDARAWARGPSTPDTANSRLYLLDDYLGVAAPQSAGVRVDFIPTSSISLPDSCDTERARMRPTSHQATAAAFDESGDRAAWIDEKGAVNEWRRGQTSELLVAPSDAPTASEVRRVYRRDDYLLLVTDDAIWIYELDSHGWTRTRLDFPSSLRPSLADINVERSGSREIVVVTTTGRDFYFGQFTPPAKSVELARILAAPATTFGASGSQLIDVQENGDGYWTFVLTDRIKYYDPDERRWLPDLLIGLPAEDDTLRYEEALGRRVAVANRGKDWWIAQSTDTPPDRFARFALPDDESYTLDAQGVVWSLDGDGRLNRCDADEGTIYTCTSQLPAPFRLNPERIQAAWEWQDLILFAEPPRLRAFDPASGETVTLPGDAAAFDAVDEARTFRSQLWLRSGDRLLILEKRAGSVEGRFFDGVQRLIMDDDGQPWVLRASGWQRWSNGEFVAPAVQPASDAPLTVYAAEEATVTALDGDGYPYSWRSGALRRDELALPEDIEPRTVSSLMRGSQDDWWAISGSNLLHVIPDVCHHPVPTPPPSTAAPPPTSTPIPTPATPQFDEQGSPIATPTPTDTPTVTPTPSATPTPTPVPYPCLTQRQSFDLAARAGAFDRAALVAAVADVDELTLIDRNGAALELRPAGGELFNVTVRAGERYLPSDLAVDAWPELQRFVVALKGGDAFDAATDLRVAGSGALMLARPSRERQLVRRAATRLTQPSALDVSWLRWERATDSFAVRTPSGMQSFGASDFVVDGQLLFEPARALLAVDASDIEVANAHGVWRFPSTDLGLNHRPIRFQPVDWRAPILAAHGHFLAADGELPAGQNSLTSVSASTAFDLGDAHFSENLRGRSVEVTVDIGGVDRPAFAAGGGFVWDDQRRGLAYVDGDLLLQSAAGIHPLVGFGPFDPGPDQQARAGGRITSEDGGDLYFLADGVWYVRQGGRWTNSVEDPARDRELLSNSDWAWTMQDGALDLTLAGARHRFADSVQPGGDYGFNADQLRSATAHDGELYVATRAFLETATGPDDLAGWDATRLSPLSTARLESLRRATSSPALFSTTVAGRVERWDAGTQTFAAVSEDADPYQRRPAVETPRLRFTRFPDRVEKELALDTLRGTTVWSLFDFVEERLPFDVILSLAVLDDDLYLGSAAGLQVYAGGASTGLDDLEPFLDMRGVTASRTDPPQAVVRVGAPFDASSLIMARAASHCVEGSARAGFSRCEDASLLDDRLRGATDLWRWTQHADGSLIGDYRLADGTFEDEAVRLRDGRFPHDHVADVAVCAGRATQLWRNGWVTLLSDASLRLRGGLTTYDLSQRRLADLFCLESTTALTLGAPSPGLYALGRNGAFWRYARGWARVSDDDDVAGLLDYLERPPILARNRLRLVTPHAGEDFQFEQRTLAGEWKPLPWTRGRLGLDAWREAVVTEDGLWVATDAGLVPIEVDSAGRAYLDPDAFVLVREPRPDGETCAPTDLALLDEARDLVAALCDFDSALVFQGELTPNKDSGVFRPFSGDDPFAEMQMAETPYWSWRLTNRTGGSPGLMQATRKFGPTDERETLSQSMPDEAIALFGGRFDFDSLTSLAAFSAAESQAQIGTAEAGWYSVPWQGWHLRDWARPDQNAVDPSAVTEVGMTREDATALLCLRVGQDEYIRLDSLAGDAQQTQTCYEFLGEDGFWQHFAGADELVIETSLSVGQARRVLVAGRFNDDRTIGLPSLVETEEGLRVFTPTEAGVLELERTLRPRFLYAPPFPGLAEGDAPRALLFHPLLDEADPSGQPVVYGGQGAFYRLGATSTELEGFRFDAALPAPARITSGPHDTLSLGWAEGETRRWLLFNLAQPAQPSTTAMPIEVHEFDRFIASRAERGNPASRIYFQVGGQQASVTWDGAMAWHSIPYGGKLDVFEPILYGDQLFVFGRQDVLEINLEWAMEAAHAAAQAKDEAEARSATIFAQETPTVPMTPALSHAAGILSTSESTPASALDLITPTAVSPVMTVEINIDRLIVRSGPGSQYSPLLQPSIPGQVRRAIQLDANTVVTAIGISPDRRWLQVELQESVERGWIFIGDPSYVTLGGPMDTLTVLETD